jgi:hypothetical protein
MAKGKKDKKHKKAKAEQAAQGQSADGVTNGSIKLPKSLRKAGEKAIELASQPMVSEIVAAALLSAAAALRSNKHVARVASAAGEEGLAAAGEASKQASKMGDAMRDLAIDLARRTLDGWERPGSEKRGGNKPADEASKP